MKERIKRLLSYIYEIDIERITSQINGELQVCWSSGRKVLHSRTSNYSYGSLHRVLRQAMQEAGIRKSPPEKVLVLGLGAGSAVHILREEWKLHPMITGIESDQAVLMLAKKHFGLEEGTGLQIILDDAAVFMETCTDTFDLVLVDLFVGNLVPETFMTHTFWDCLKRSCQPGGKVLFNILVFNQKTLEQARQLEAMATQRFPLASSIILSGKWNNHVIYAVNGV